jgi:hypothetical protein
LNTPNAGDFEVMFPADARAIFADQKQNALGTRLVATFVTPQLRTDLQQQEISLSEEELASCLKNLDTSKASGPHGVSARLLE